MKDWADALEKEYWDKITVGEVAYSISTMLRKAKADGKIEGLGLAREIAENCDSSSVILDEICDDIKRLTGKIEKGE